MKVVLALALFLWAAAAHHTPEHNLKKPFFLASQTQRYELTLNVTSGIPGLTSQLAKSVIKATVNIRPKTETEYLLKIEDVKVSEPTSSVANDEEDLPLRRVSQLESDLSKPIKFILRDGEIESYTLEKTESVISKKIKRSILRHLEAKLEDKENHEYPNTLEEYPYVYNVTKERNYGPVTQMYVVNVSPFPEFPYEKNVFNISKTEIYEPLGYPANHTHHNFAKQGCPEVCRLENCNVTNKYGAGCPFGYEPHHTPLKMYLTTHYNLRMWQHRMILENMYVEEKHIASMYDQDMVITITAEYNLAEVSDKRIEEPREQTEYTTLEEDDIQEEEETKTEEVAAEASFLTLLFPKIRLSEVVNVIERTLERLVQTVVKPELERKETQLVGEHIIVLQRAMTFLKKKDLETVWRKIVDVNNYRKASEEEKVKRQIFLDILPLIGTEEGLEFIKTLIEEQKVTIWEAKELLEAVTDNLVTPSERNIKNLYALLELSHVKRQHVLHSAVYITLARVMKAACVDPMFHNVTEMEDSLEVLKKPYLHLLQKSRSEPEDRPYGGFLGSFKSQSKQTFTGECPRQFVLKFVEEIAQKLWSAKTMQEKIIYIETLAHLSSPKVLPVVLPYVYGTAKDIIEWAPADVDFMKTATLYALHNFVGYFPYEVLRYTSPVFFNLTEVPRVRIAAFSALMRAQPPLSLLKHIALDSWNEPSNEVGSFVYSTVQTFGNSSEPCMKLTSKRIKLVISQFKNYDIGHQHAKAIIKTFFDKVRNFGIQATNTFVPSNESYVPHAMYTSWVYNIDSLKDVLLQLAFNVQGLTEEDIFKLIDVEIMGMRWPKDIPHAKENEIFGALNLLPRLPKELRMTIYKKVFYTSTYTFIDAETIKNTVEPLYEHLKNIFSSGRTGIRGHIVKVFVPSTYHTFGIARTLAFPVEFNMRHPLLLSLKVKENMVQNGKYQAVKFFIRPTVFYTEKLVKHVINPIDNKAYGVYFEQKFVYSLPLEMHLHFNNENNTIVLTTKLPELPARIMWYHSEAGTYCGDVLLEKLPSLLNREPIRTIPTLFEKEKMLEIPTLPLVQLVSHSEDITEGIEDIPRTWEEAVAIAFKYLRNPGWRKKGLNVTIVKNPRYPVEMITVMLSYNKTEKVPEQQLHASNDWSAVEEDIDTDDNYGSLRSSKEDLGLPKSVAKKIYESFLHRHLAHEFEVLVETSPSPSVAHLRVEYNHTYDRTRHSLMAFVKTKTTEKRTPYEVCFTHVMQYENIPNEFEYNVRKYGNQRADFYNAINFKECNIFKTADITTRGSFVHVPYEELFDRNEFADTLRKEWFLPETHEECVKDLKEGKTLSVPCMRAIREEAIFNRYKIRTEYKKEIPEIVRNITNKVHDAVKYAFYSQADINRLNVQNPENTVEITLDYINKLADVPVVNVHLKTPEENIHYHKINVEKVKPMSGLYNWQEIGMNKVTNNTYPPTCVLMEKYVRTFDLRAYKLPEDQCTYILSTHCTENKKFVVLAKHITTTQKEITVFVEDHKIVLKSSGRRGNYVVVFDGKDYTLAKNMPVVFEPEAHIHAFIIPVSNGQPEELLAFHAENAGIKIVFDGKIVKLLVNPMYKGKLCGLCSEFDGETTQEFRGINQCVYSDSLDFARSAIVDSNKCGVSTTPKKPVYCPYGENVVSEEDVSPSEPLENEDEMTEDNLRKPKRRTIHIQREDKVCFSVQPMPMCVEDAVPEETERQRAEFHCLPKYDASTRKLVIESRKRILRELANKSVDFSETISVPKTCSE